jgi:hypothetical protein
MDKDIIPNKSTNEQEPQSPANIQLALSRWKEASTHLLPNDLPSLIASIGVLAGIVYYFNTQNPWLLLTFISILFGKKVVDQIHHS